MVVQGEALFRGDAPAPTNSHLIRTVVTEASKGRSIFSWQLEPQSVQSSGKLWRSSRGRATAVRCPPYTSIKAKTSSAWISAFTFT